MPDFPLRRLRAILDFRKQLWLDPDTLVRDSLGVRLRLANERLQSFLQFCGRRFVESVVNLARINKIISLVAPEIDAVPFAFVECEAGDG